MKKVPIIEEKEPSGWNPWSTAQPSEYEGALDEIAGVVYDNYHTSSDKALIHRITSILHSVGK